MNELNNDVLLKISESLNVKNVIYICALSKWFNNKTDILMKGREHEIESGKNEALWCNICDKKVSNVAYHILFICTCDKSENYPYYHLDCLNNVQKKTYGMNECPRCNRRKSYVML